MEEGALGCEAGKMGAESVRLGRVGRFFVYLILGPMWSRRACGGGDGKNVNMAFRMPSSGIAGISS